MAARALLDLKLVLLAGHDPRIYEQDAATVLTTRLAMHLVKSVFADDDEHHQQAQHAQHYTHRQQHSSASSGYGSGLPSPTTQQGMHHVVDVDEQLLRIELLDSDDTDQFAEIRDSYIKFGHGFIILFSLLSEASFSGVPYLRDQVLRVKKQPDVPIIVCGAMYDPNDARAVSYEDAFGLAESWGVQYFEIFSKQKVTADELLFYLVRQALHAPPSTWELKRQAISRHSHMMSLQRINAEEQAQAAAAASAFSSRPKKYRKKPSNDVPVPVPQPTRLSSGSKGKQSLTASDELPPPPPEWIHTPHSGTVLPVLKDASTLLTKSNTAPKPDVSSGSSPPKKDEPPRVVKRRYFPRLSVASLFGFASPAPRRDDVDPDSFAQRSATMPNAKTAAPWDAWDENTAAPIASSGIVRLPELILVESDAVDVPPHLETSPRPDDVRNDWQSQTTPPQQVHPQFVGGGGGGNDDDDDAYEWQEDLTTLTADKVVELSFKHMRRIQLPTAEEGSQLNVGFATYEYLLSKILMCTLTAAMAVVVSWPSDIRMNLPEEKIITSALQSISAFASRILSRADALPPDMQQEHFSRLVPMSQPSDILNFGLAVAKRLALARQTMMYINRNDARSALSVFTGVPLSVFYQCGEMDPSEDSSIRLYQRLAIHDSKVFMECLVGDDGLFMQQVDWTDKRQYNAAVAKLASAIVDSVV